MHPVESAQNFNFFAVRAVGPKFFGFSMSIFRDNIVRSVENLFCGAVILFKFYNFRIRIMFFKIQNILHRGPAPTVNALIVIADYRDIAIFFRKQIN